MGMLDRYKKKGGFFQLLQLIETSPQKKKDQFLSLIAEENPVWEDQLRKKILTIEKIYNWDQSVLAEVFTRLPPLTLAVAMHGNTPEYTDKLLACLPPITKRKIYDLISDANPSPAEKLTCEMKIITEVRGYVAQGLIKLEKIDVDLHMPDNFDDMLITMSIGNLTDVSAFKASTASATTVAEVNISSAESTSKGSSTVSTISSSNTDMHEIEFLKRKINQLSAEINGLKSENAVLKDKLSQIKKIA